MTVKRHVPGDDPALWAFLRAHHVELVECPMLAPVSDWDEFERFHEHPGQVIFAAGADEVAGYCVLTPYLRADMTHRIQLGAGVLEAHRGKGWGRKLLNAGIGYARQAGYDWVDGIALSTNHRVLALDLQVGFKVRALIDDFMRVDGQSVGLYQMSIDLRRVR